MFAELALNRPVQQTFTYHIPSGLAGKLQPGHLVRVQFRTAQESAIVVSLTPHKPDFQTKPVLERLDPHPVLTSVQLALGRWLSNTTATPIGLCLWLMLPPGLTGKNDVLYQLEDDTYLPQGSEETQLVSLLRRRGALTGKQLTAAMTKTRWSKAMKPLLKNGIVTGETVLGAPAVQPKTLRTARLSIKPAQIDGLAARLGRESKRANVLEVLAAHPAHRMPLPDVLEAAGCSDSVVKTLAKAGALDILSTEPREVVLCLSPEAAHEEMIALRGGQTYLAILRLLAERDDPLPVSDIYERTGATAAHLAALHEDGLITLGESEFWRDSLSERVILPALAPPLTAPQQAVWEPIRAHMEALYWGQPVRETGVFLLHGVTGSGKTEIYMRAVQHALAQGRQAILLVPEIALTAQMIQRFSARFPGQIALVHSTLSPGERYDTWRRARERVFQVAIGARSALFTPLPDVGVVILDEEHDDSYKQSPPVVPPYYHARETAIEMMRLNGGTVILGSATPDVITYHRATQGDYTLLHLPDRVLAHRERLTEQTHRLNLPDARYEPIEGSDAAGLPLPPVSVVDMRQELRVGNTSVFSRQLNKALHETLEAGQQALLFLNRRGTATYVFCRDCGYIARCPHCSTTLTYHRAGDALTCHACGRRSPNPTQCPQCGSNRIKYFGRGTEQIETLLKAEFPTARVLRWDQDTASQRGAHERIYEAFSRREADILVGTQMIAKGLDLPLVTLVGIISGDTALGLPDYRAGENTFQLLTQVAGRAGRGLLGGRVILQTYQPEHYAIQAASQHDYQGFYEQEIGYRAGLRWPPFTGLARVLFRHKVEEQARLDAEQTTAFLKERITRLHLTATEITGPTPSFFTRLDDYFRWQVIIRSPDPTRLFQDVDLPASAILDIAPVDIL